VADAACHLARMSLACRVNGACAEDAVDATITRAMQPMARPAYRPLRRVEYERLVELGLFERERIELVRGRLVVMSAQGTRHIAVTRRVAVALIRHVPPQYAVQSHSPLAVDDISMPEPDVSVTPSEPDHVYPHDAILVVEVSWSSLAYDQDDKRSLYAAGRVPVYWLVDLHHDEIRVHTDPLGDGEDATYRTVQTLRAGDVLRLAAVPELAIPVSEILFGDVTPSAPH
jgi:Uma2 family endonuclease